MKTYPAMVMMYGSGPVVVGEAGGVVDVMGYVTCVNLLARLTA